jgi:hypothetical protein
MPFLDEIISNARLRLGDPLPQNPSIRVLFKFAIDHCQSMYNSIGTVSRGWATSEVPLQVSPGISDYMIPASDFGKPLLVYTVDSVNPSHWERPVSFFEIQNLPLAYQGPANGANAMANFVDGSFHTAMGIAFYRANDQAMVRIRPVPQAVAEYRIIYSVGDWASSADVSSIPALREHHHLIEVRSALSALPFAKWAAGDDEESVKLNDLARKSLAPILAKDEAQFARDFAGFIRSVGGHRVSFRSGFGAI